MSDCRCFNPPFDYQDYDTSPVGTDMTNGRYGEVTLKTCKHCGTIWLNYHVEYESYTASGRWFRGPISRADATKMAPESAIAYLERLPWYFAGGSYFRSCGERWSGPIHADL
ncbi:MAG: hypothetical protein LBE85_12760 [Candidatus Accumulibacter sp.]|jgi:hypothetical protein|nr:hypothetical protein [Accumulibacter sp.]